MRVSETPYFCGAIMKFTIQDKELESFIEDRKNGGNRFKKYAKDKLFYEKLLNVFRVFRAIDSVEDLRPPFTLFAYLHYERLRYQGEPMSSVRVMNGRVERVLFREVNDGIEIVVIKLDDTHYGNKK